MIFKFIQKSFIYLLFLMLFGFALASNLQAANTIDGYCYLDGESNHYDSKVLFSAESPSAVTDSTITDSSGYFSLQLESGIYDIIYSHNGRATYTIQDTFLTTTTTLPPLTLFLGLNGSLSDTLFSTYNYHVTDDIILNSDDTLLIQPGTVITFNGYYSFTIEGLLFADATDADSILFTSNQTNPAAGDWQGIKFEDTTDPNTLFSFTIIEYADTALTFDDVSLKVNNNLIFSNNVGIQSKNSAALNIYNNTISNNDIIGVSCITNSNPDIRNNIFYENDTGIEAQSSPDGIEYNLFWSNTTAGSGGNLPSYFGQLITVNANGDSCDTYLNLFLDPLFVDAAAKNFYLTANSPSIDAGDPAFSYNPDSTVSDMGAYYYYQSNIRGSIALNGGSGEITDVEITADSLTVNPDANGDYQLTISPGTYDVTVSLANYADTTKNDVQVQQFESTTAVDFALDPLPGSISGTVNLANRVGDITEVEISADGVTTNPDSSGVYTITALSPGNYDVTASLTNYADSTINSVTVSENQTTTEINFTLIALPGTIEGYVNLSGGFEEVTNIEVSAGGETVNPDTTGNYSISLQPGNYNVMADHTNYTDSTVANVNVVENAATTGVDFTLDPLPGSVSGTVSLSNRVGDVTEVEVTLDSITVNPDSSGYYNIPSQYPGYYDVTASLTNYHDSTQVDVQILENQDTTTDFTLIALPGTIQGTVAISDSAGELSNVEISAAGVTVNADSTGTYSLAVQPGSYDVTASLTDYADTTVTDVQVIENADTSGINFTLHPLPGTITGTVSLANRPGNLTDVELTAGGVTVNPDSSGAYSIILEEGVYDVAAALTNYEDSTITDVEVYKNQTTTDVNFTLIAIPGSITGSVTLADRRGEITDVTVTVDTITVHPDSSGFYNITAISPGTYDVTASLANYVDSTITEVEVVENQTTNNIDFTLIALPGSISGTVSLASKDWDVSEAEVSADGVTVNPDTTGAYSIILQPGTYDVTATLTNYADSTVSGILVVENQDTSDVDFAMQPAYGSIEGTVSLVGGTGDVVDAVVHSGDNSTSPDDSGYYILNNLSPGFHDVTASLSGYPSSTIEDVEVFLVQITSGADITLIAGPPIVDFSADPDSGCVPLEVQFTDLSTNQPSSWFWQFGDGNTSTEQNPTHTYSESGFYTVSLQATNASGTNTLSKEDLIKAGQPPTANFGATPTSGTAPLGVSFINQSTQISGFPTSWEWDFGDGSSSNSQSPGHVYQNGGLYSVSLIASNDCGSDTLTKTDFITVYSQPDADFSADPDSGCQPLNVQFTDLSTNIPTSWEWSFGDGATTTAQNPSHEYNGYGLFTVTLTVSNPAGSDTETKMNYITVNGRPVADAGPDQIVFENVEITLDGSASYDPEEQPLIYQWIAADSIQLSDSTIVNPTFISPPVEDSTEYNFILTVDDGQCTSDPDTVVITVRDNPVGIDELKPEQFELVGVYPNPTKNHVKISFGLHKASQVNVKLYDVRGRFVEALAHGNMESGYHEIEFNMNNLNSGIYFYRLDVDGVNQTIDKIILLR